MELLSLTALEEIMRQFVWEGDWPSFEQAQDQPFDELGYDSLSLLETHTLLRRQFAVTIAEDDFGRVDTPRKLVTFVNEHHQAA